MRSALIVFGLEVWPWACHGSVHTHDPLTLDNGKENGNYHSILGLYGANEKSMETIIV